MATGEALRTPGILFIPSNPAAPERAEEGGTKRGVPADHPDDADEEPVVPTPASTAPPQPALAMARMPSW